MGLEEQGWRPRLQKFVNEHKSLLADPDSVLPFYARHEDDKAEMERLVAETEWVRGRILIKLGEVGGGKDGDLSVLARQKIQERAAKILEANKNCSRGRIGGRFYDYGALRLRPAERLWSDPVSGIVLEQQLTDQAARIGSHFLVSGAYSSEYPEYDASFYLSKPEPTDFLKKRFNRYKLPLPPDFADALYKGERNQVEVIFDGREKTPFDRTSMVGIEKGHFVAVIIWTKNTDSNGRLALFGEGFHVGHEDGDIFLGKIDEITNQGITIRNLFGDKIETAALSPSSLGSLRVGQVFTTKIK